MITYIKNIFSAKYILLSFLRQDLKTKYRNTVLGIGWNFLSPLGIVLIIGTVYSSLFSIPMKELVPFLFSGLLPWLFLTGCSENGAMAFLGASGYIKQTRVPLEIFPLRHCLLNMVNLVFSIFAFLLIYIIMSPSSFNGYMLLIVPALVIWFVFCAAWATITGMINLYLRDFQPLQSLLLQGLFYASPIIYKPEMLAAKYEWIYKYNPIYHLLEIIRKPLLGQGPATATSWAVSIAMSLLLLLLAVYLIRKIGRSISFRL